MSTNFASSGRSPVEEDEKQLCLNCLSPNSPQANFCSDCGAPLSSYAATGPLEHIFAQGHVYRRAVAELRSILVVIGIWLVFAPSAAWALMPLMEGDQTGVLGFVTPLLFTPISLLILWKTTRHYFAQKTVL
jgi:hypothetical protein